MSIGKGTDVGRQLTGFVERIEQARARKQDIADDEKAIFAEAKAAGFETKVIRAVIKWRESDATAREEFQAILETYLHALGHAEEPPLFRHFGLISTDKASREAAVSAFMEIVPEHGEIIVKPGGGGSFRVYRDSDGNPQNEAWTEVVGLHVDDPIDHAGAEAGDRRPAGKLKSPESARKAGIKAGKAGGAARNPFADDKELSASWQDGWREGAGIAEAAPA